MISQTDSSELLEAAFFHFENGRPVIAVNKAKKPYENDSWNVLFSRRQSEEEVRERFSNGAYGIAIVLWPACPYVVLDFDGPHAQEAWQSTGIELPETARNFTRSGGVHLYFRMPHTLSIELKRRVRLVKAPCDCPKSCGVDLLIHGYALVPPTPGYREDPDFPLEDAVTIPAKILALAAEKPKAETRRTGDASGRVGQGERNAVACSLAGTMRTRGMSVEAIDAALKADNEQRFDPPLSDKEIEGVVKQAAKWAPGTTVEPEHLTDLGNAGRFASQHANIIRYSHERGQWLLWNGKRWEWDRSGAAVALAKLTVRSIYAECEREPDKSRREALGEHARKSENDARIRAMLNLAQSEVPIRLDDLDRHPFLLNCENGVIDLATGDLIPHDAKLMLTRLCPVEFNPHARCESFFAFLDEIMKGNKSLIEFLQVWFGYSLTADVREQVVAFFHGLGSNGKSTLLEAVAYTMGDYACMAAPGLLMAKRNEQHPTEIADLFGKRLVVTVETQEGRRFNESIFKWLSGGDRLKARFMKQDFFEFAATHKFTIAANHKPVVSDTTESFWRRLKLVPFNVKIDKEKRDKKLPEKLKTEADGILAWMVKGAVKWHKDGLPEPPDITEATENYRVEEDFLAQFLTDCCEVAKSKDDEAQVGKLHERFKRWSEDMDEKPVSSKRLSAMLKERGFENYQATDGKFRWSNLALKA